MTNTKKNLLARKSIDKLNALTITSYAEEQNNLLLDIVFLKFQKKVTGSNPIVLQVKIFDVRKLANIINQVVKVIQTKQEKKEKDLFYTSTDTINSGGNTKFNTVQISYKENKLHINAYSNKEEQISLGFNKVEIIPLVDTLKLFADYSDQKYFEIQSHFSSS